MDSELADRSQKIVVSVKLSSNVNDSGWVPQGQELGFTLFNIFLINITSLTKFAEDTKTDGVVSIMWIRQSSKEI